MSADRDAERRRVTPVFVVLIVVTVVSWLLGRSGAPGAAVAHTGATLGVLAIAALKSRLVVRTFMEISTAPRWVRIGTDAWLAALMGTIAAFYLAS